MSAQNPETPITAAMAEFLNAPCAPGACEEGGEPCSTHERLWAHAEGDHELCEPDCTPDALPQWLYGRFSSTWGGVRPDWNELADVDRSYWAHQARAVRRAVERGGFKASTSHSCDNCDGVDPESCMTAPQQRRSNSIASEKKND